MIDMIKLAEDICLKPYRLMEKEVNKQTNNEGKGTMKIKPEFYIPDGMGCTFSSESSACRFLLHKNYCILFNKIANINVKCNDCIDQCHKDNP